MSTKHAREYECDNVAAKKSKSEEEKSIIRYLTDDGWLKEISNEFKKSYFLTLLQTLEKMKQSEIILPPEDQFFRALNLCTFDKVKVVILGQDPYMVFFPNIETLIL